VCISHIIRTLQTIIIISSASVPVPIIRTNHSGRYYKYTCFHVISFLLSTLNHNGNIWAHFDKSYNLNNYEIPPIRTDCGIARSKRDGTRAETRFGLSAKRRSPFKSAGVSVQSTTGSRGVRNSGQRLFRPCSDVQCKTTGYPLHSHLSPSIPLPCVTVCHQVPNALYMRRDIQER